MVQQTSMLGTWIERWSRDQYCSALYQAHGVWWWRRFSLPISWRCSRPGSRCLTLRHWTSSFTRKSPGLTAECLHIWISSRLVDTAPASVKQGHVYIIPNFTPYPISFSAHVISRIPRTRRLLLEPRQKMREKRERFQNGVYLGLTLILSSQMAEREERHRLKMEKGLKDCKLDIHVSTLLVSLVIRGPCQWS